MNGVKKVIDSEKKKHVDLFWGETQNLLKWTTILENQYLLFKLAKWFGYLSKVLTNANFFFFGGMKYQRFK